MGFTGVHLLVLLIPLVVLAGAAIGLYFLVKKAVAAGVREGQATALLKSKRRQ